MLIKNYETRANDWYEVWAEFRALVERDYVLEGKIGSFELWRRATSGVRSGSVPEPESDGGIHRGERRANQSMKGKRILTAKTQRALLALRKVMPAFFGTRGRGSCR